MRAALTFAVVFAATVMVAGTLIGADPASARGLTGNIEVTAHALSRTHRSVSPRGRVSDTTEQVWGVNDRWGRSIGRLLLSCRWVSGSSRLCNGTLRMPRGDVQLGGVSPTPFNGTFAVVGGTHAYVAASGEATFTTIGVQQMVLLVTLT